MYRLKTSRKFPRSRQGLLWGLLFCVLPATANVLTVEVERLDTPVANVDDLVISLAWPEGAEQGAMSLTAKRLDAGEYGYRWRDLRWTCDLTRAAETWQCAGPVRARGASGLNVSARLDEGGIVVEAYAGRGRAHVDHRYDPDQALRAQLVRVPASWLAPLLNKAWKDGHTTGGTVDLDWQIRIGDDEITFAGPLTVSGLGLDSKDGSIATEGVSATGELQGTLTDRATTVRLDLTLTGGEVLLGPLYASLPASAVSLGMTLATTDMDQWRVDALRWHDPGVLEITGAARLDFAAGSFLRDADLQFSSAALAPAHARYFDSLAASLGLSGLTIEGSAHGKLVLHEADWQALDIALAKVRVKDGQGRFGAEGLSGTFGVRHAQSAVESTLSWQSAQVYGLRFGAATLPLRSVAGGVALRAPVAIPLFGGVLRVAMLDYAPVDDDTHLNLAMALEHVELAALGAAFGWPEFTGTISGELPSVHYADDRLEFDGGLTAQMFDGRVRVSQLSMERPFGVAPMLAASIDFFDLDLEPLTGAFGFGEISGRLNGHVRGLRLVDWEPVAFDAAFQTVKRPGVRQRISQRALRDLTEVGGGGIAAGLQAQLLRAFASFGYDRIGLSCVLSNNICTMGGVGRAADGGYIIVEGSGLPRVSVIGHQTRVDWPVLVARLTAATEGQAPVIQ